MAAEGGRGGMSLSHHKKWENGGGRRQEDKPPLRMSFLVRDWTNIVTVFEITPTPLKLKPCLLKLPPSVSSCTLGIGGEERNNFKARWYTMPPSVWRGGYFNIYGTVMGHWDWGGREERCKILRRRKRGRRLFFLRRHLL